MMASPKLLALFGVLLAVLVSACGDDEEWVSNYGPVVGGPCTDAFECKSGSICARGGDFPEGTCSVPCDDHDECPGASLCVARQGGACLLACTADADCRDEYKCKDIDAQAGGAKARVCIK